jgi:hypothetical protein
VDPWTCELIKLPAGKSVLRLNGLGDWSPWPATQPRRVGGLHRFAQPCRTAHAGTNRFGAWTCSAHLASARPGKTDGRRLPRRCRGSPRRARWLRSTRGPGDTVVGHPGPVPTPEHSTPPAVTSDGVNASLLGRGHQQALSERSYTRRADPRGHGRGAHRAPGIHRCSHRGRDRRGPPLPDGDRRSDPLIERNFSRVARTPTIGSRTNGGTVPGSDSITPRRVTSRRASASRPSRPTSTSNTSMDHRIGALSSRSQ